MSDPILDKLYATIKDNEEKFPLPLPCEEILMGTFDVKTGSFKGKTTTKVVSHEDSVWPIPNPVVYTGDTKITTRWEGRKLVITTMYAPKTEAVKVVLEFTAQYPEKSLNATEDPPEWNEQVRFTANGKSVTATKKKPSVKIDVEIAQSVNWSVRGNGKQYKDSIEIRRQPIIVLGAFTVPAIPVTILYEPPPDKNLQSYQEQITITSVGTTFTMGFKEEESTTKPTQPREYQSALKMKAGLEGAAGILSKIPNPVAAAGAQAMKVIASGLGEASAKTTTGNIISEQHSITTVNRKRRQLRTGPPNSGGPGQGDLIYFLKDVRFLYYACDGQFHLCLVDPGSWANIRVGFLKKHIGNKSLTGLDRSTGEALLAINPFAVNGPDFDPSTSDRYRYIITETRIASGGPDSFGEECEITQEDSRYQEEFKTILEDYRPGFLAAFGLGIQERKTIESTVCSSNSSVITHEKKVETNVGIFVADDEIYIVDVYLDRIFGTFAFKLVNHVVVPVLSGKLQQASGLPISGEILELRQGRRKYRTITDDDGKFAFHAATIEPGAATLWFQNKQLRRITLRHDRPSHGLRIKLMQ